MKILLVSNNFTGAYGSLKCFISEVFFYLSNMGNEVFLTDRVEKAIEIYERFDIDFSLGIGKYYLYLGEIALYDIYQKIHYQWIIDNPLKMEMDYKSKFIKYIFIDKLFEDCVSGTKLSPIFLPLGIPDFFTDLELKRKDGIVFAGQIRDANIIYNKIQVNKNRRIIMMVVDKILDDFDLPYIRVLNRYTSELSVYDKREVFALSNSFIRSYKREKVLNAIKGIPVYLIGENQCELLTRNTNVIQLGKMRYYDSFSIMKQYTFCINIDPNFNDGFHDRILRAAANGNIVITKEGRMQKNIFENNIIFYKVSDVMSLCEKILSLRDSEIEKMRLKSFEIARKYFHWIHILNYIINDYGGECDGSDRLYRILGN